jgi:hypothetical protein
METQIAGAAKIGRHATKLVESMATEWPGHEPRRLVDDMAELAKGIVSLQRRVEVPTAALDSLMQRLGVAAHTGGGAGGIHRDEDHSEASKLVRLPTPQVVRALERIAKTIADHPKSPN